MTKVSMIGLDLAKHVFQVHGVDGRVEVSYEIAGIENTEIGARWHGPAAPALHTILVEAAKPREAEVNSVRATRRRTHGLTRAVAGEADGVTKRLAGKTKVTVVPTPGALAIARLPP